MKAKTIKKYLSRAAMTLLMTVLTTAGARAADFITDVMLIGGTTNDVARLRDYYEDQGYTFINKDLNEGINKDRDYIYLLYKKASNQDDVTFITDFYISTQSGTVPEAISANGRNYSLVPYDGGETFVNGQGNLNSRVGGTNIHLYLSIDRGNDSPDRIFSVNSIFFDDSQSGAVGNNGGSNGYDLNSGAGGDYIYMHFTTAVSKGWTINKNVAGTECYITGYEGYVANIEQITIPNTIDGATVQGVSMDFSGFTSLYKINFYMNTVIPDMPYVQYLTNLESIDLINPSNNQTVAQNTLPNSMTDIGNAFRGSGIKKLTMPNVTSMGDFAFEGCNNLNSVTFKKAASIGLYAFSKINKSNSTAPKTTITYTGPLSNWSWSNYEYSPNLVVNCEGGSCGWCGDEWNKNNYHKDDCLYWVLSNDHLTIDCIPMDDFYENYGPQQVIKTKNWNTTAVKSLALEHVYDCGSITFTDCTNLTSVSINSIPILAKNYTSSSSFSTIFGNQVKTYTIGNDVTSIGNYAFYGCSGLTSLNIGNHVTSIGNYAFYGCSGLTPLNIPDGVTSIGDYAFFGCSGLTSLNIGNHVTSIGSFAFSNCSGLTSIVVDSGNPNYDNRNNCNAIIETNTNTLIAGCMNTVIPNVREIGDGAFYGCIGLTAIDIPNSVTSISKSAFYGCSGLTAIDIPDNVVNIESSAFYGCSGLTSIDISNSVTRIRNSTFYGCSGLSSIDIPDNVIDIGESAFQGCSGLTSIDIPDKVLFIGNSAFEGCSSLSSVIIPSSVANLGNYAFAECPNLTSLSINSNGIVSLNRTDRPFKNYFGNQVKTLTIGDEVTCIGEFAFKDFSCLTSVTVGDSLTTIHRGAFYGCSALRTFTIPASVTYIGNEAFYGCTGMTDVYCYADPEEMSWNGLHDFRGTCETICHVFDASAWEDFLVNVTFEDDLAVRLMDNADNTGTLDIFNDQQRNVMLVGRTLYLDGGWNTLCLPFTVRSLSGTPLKGFTVKQLDTENTYDGHKTGFDSGTLYLNFKDATRIKAGQPYIVKHTPTADTGNLSYTPISGTAGEYVEAGYESLVDGNIETTWASYQDKCIDGIWYCEFAASEIINVTGYTITTSSSHSVSNFNPQVWTLKAKLNESDDWTTIDSRDVTQNSADALPNSPMEPKNYDIPANKQALYQYFRFEASNTNITYLALGELAILGAIGNPPAYTPTAGTDGWTTQIACGYDRLLDGKTGAGHNWWPSFSNGSAYCEFDAGESVYATGYTLITGNQNVNQDPRVWTLQAKLKKNDAWTVIDSRDANENTGDALPGSRTVGKDYTIQQPDIYRYFRFEVTQNGGGSNLCLSELEMKSFKISDAATIKDPKFEYVYIDNTAPAVITSEDGAVSFKGTYNPVSIGSGGDNTILFMGAANTVYYPTAAMNINAFRAYFQLQGDYVCGNPSQGANAINKFVLNFEESETTGIKTTNDTNNTNFKNDNTWYSIDGRRLNGKPTVKGVYINNGKKIVIK